MTDTRDEDPSTSPVSGRERAVIIHALGLTPRGGSKRLGRRLAYRNYFAAGEADVPVWRKLEAKGMARQVCRPGSLRPFHTFTVTESGVTAAGISAYVPASLLDLTEHLCWILPNEQEE